MTKILVSISLALFCAELYGSTGTSWDFGTPSSSTNTQKKRAKKSAWIDVTKPQSRARTGGKPQRVNHNVGGGGTNSGMTLQATGGGGTNSGMTLQATGGGGTNSGSHYVGYTSPNYQPFHIDSLLQTVGGFDTNQATGQCRDAVDQAKTQVNLANEKIQQARTAMHEALQAKTEARDLKGNAHSVCSWKGGISSQWVPAQHSFVQEAQQYLGN